VTPNASQSFSASGSKIPSSAFLDATEVWGLLDLDARGTRLDTVIALDEAGAGRAAMLIRKACSGS